MFSIFVKSLVIGYSGAVMPGTLLAYTIDKSIKKGARAGFLISLGHILLEFVVVAALFSGLGKFLETAAVKTVIGLVGGAVLVYLGVSMIRDIIMGRTTIDINSGSAYKQGNLVLGGALLSASNPYFTIWWAAVGLGLIMNAYNTFGFAGIAAFYMGHILADITWYVFVSNLISRTRKFISKKIYNIIIIILGSCLLAFGISFIAASLV